MRELSLEDARMILARATKMSSEDAINFLLAQYDSSSQSVRDVLVFALIGDLVAAQQFAVYRDRARVTLSAQRSAEAA